MDLGALLTFVPLIAGLALLGFLIFKKDLPSKGLGNILTYFIGILIIFVAVGLLIDYFIISWTNDRLQSAVQNDELDQLINTSDSILDQSFPGASNNVGAPPPTAQVVPIVVTATPSPGLPGVPAAPEQTTYIQHTVVPGDTLYALAQRYGTTVDAIMITNGLTSWTIYPGQVLTIPDP
ncbi:MAG: LysM peptidoglycan-binding domain-containing protein [Chloroflexi bacterium]|nr:LysM peptidoglycan-binding domain-containing protein [Chloroflexota bacterium]MCI0580362.1 LysM peptidoglycan-binding domain-containing protein [Chloroflexota bacterium]MCI0649526.1 LysM peptidoglycan-binding domain-containing protein [Chloroflexota bacterium]MCI0726057.1 LysM peptidoglycan-binding domain-containing protein [Chloroflexota bacterium]